MTYELRSTLLLVDDDAELSALLKQVLEERGYFVTSVASCAEARQSLASCEYTLCIIDGLLPDGFGIDLIEDLRQRGNDIPVVFISSCWDEILAVGARSLGAVRMLHKPVDPGTFVIEVGYSLRREEIAVISPPTMSPRLQAAFAQFRENIQGRIDRLGDLLGEAQRMPSELTIRAVHGEAHKLHGTAGSFGYAEVSAAAAMIEVELNRVLNGKAVATEPLWGQLDGIMRRMSAALRHKTSEAVTGPQSPSITVLVVEDDPVLLDYFRHALAPFFRTLGATSSEMALAVVDAEPVACAVIDVHLVERTAGFALAKSLRAQERYQSLPVAFISVDSSMETQLQSLYSGGSLFLTKPVTAAALLVAVQRLTAMSGGGKSKVLVFDEDDEFCENIRHTLTFSGFDVSIVRSSSLLLDSLVSTKPDVLLLDVYSDGKRSFDLCRMLRGNVEWEHLEIVLMAKDPSSEGRVTAFRSGASDYVTKPIVPVELVARLRGLLERRRR